MRKKNRQRIVVSVVSGLGFLFVFALSVQNPPQKRGLRANNEFIDSSYSSNLSS